MRTPCRLHRGNTVLHGEDEMRLDPTCPRCKRPLDSGRNLLCVCGGGRGAKHCIAGQPGHRLRKCDKAFLLLWKCIVSETQSGRKPHWGSLKNVKDLWRFLKSIKCLRERTDKFLKRHLWLLKIVLTACVALTRVDELIGFEGNYFPGQCERKSFTCLSYSEEGIKMTHIYLTLDVF